MLRIAQALAIIYLLVAVVMVGLSFRPPPAPAVVSITYGTEKRDWLEDAAARFTATNPTTSSGAPITIELEGMGSREQAVAIINGEIEPTVISPASSIHTRWLSEEWALRNNGATIMADTPQPLVITPLVVVAWEDRATALDLQQHDTLWENLHTLVAAPDGWEAFGHEEWGLGRWGHTNPETSNSGIQTITLLAYAYHDKAANLSPGDITDTGFREWFDDFEKAVPEFPSSTGFLMDDMLRTGPSKYSFIIVYENLAIDSIDIAPGRGDEIHVYYPPANILSDHPYAILDAPWVSPEQREAATIFRDFLLNEESQQRALEFGFRPADPSIALTGDDSPFVQYGDYGVAADSIDISVEPPSAEVVNELIDLWRRGDYE